MSLQIFKKLFLTAIFCFAINPYTQNLKASTKDLNNYSQELKRVNKTNINIDYLRQIPVDQYILGPGDQIRVNVSREYPELDSVVVIDGQGTINLPILNRIFVNKLTLEELTEVLTIAYSEFVKFPNLQLEILSYRPINIVVTGEVNNPGYHTMSGTATSEQLKPLPINNSEIITSFDIEDNPKEKIVKEVSFYFPTVFDAIRASGGITIYSDLSSITVTRNETISNGGGRKMTNLSFNNILRDANQAQNIRIFDGDKITIGKRQNINKDSLLDSIQSNLNPKYINVNIVGRVNNPGIKLMTRLSTLNDAIDIAGGAKVLRGPVRYLTINNDGTFEKRKIRYRMKNKRGSFQNPYLTEGDLIIVGNSLASTTAEVVNEFTEPFKGLFSAYGLIKAIED